MPLPLFSGNDVNNTAIVLKMDYIKNSFLFSGDIEQKIEKELVGYYGDGLRVNVLKTAHHGSKTSSSADFLANVQPQWAVVTCGRNNKYGHPSKETLKNLARFAINVLRTDLSTDIKMVGDGQTIQIKNKNQSI
ncbi:MAG: hypothetical protein M1127_00055 [Patescibacteria group bacterium]|nr:hypothetical protein [Patescibacteria group bacterium]